MDGDGPAAPWRVEAEAQAEAQAGNPTRAPPQSVQSSPVGPHPGMGPTGPAPAALDGILSKGRRHAQLQPLWSRRHGGTATRRGPCHWVHLRHASYYSRAAALVIPQQDTRGRRTAALRAARLQPRMPLNKSGRPYGRPYARPSEPASLGLGASRNSEALCEPHPPPRGQTSAQLHPALYCQASTAPSQHASTSTPRCQAGDDAALHTEWPAKPRVSH